MTDGPRVSFDTAKDAANREKHGLSLSIVRAVINSATATFIDDRFDYGEERFVTFGYVEGRLCVAVWTERDGRVRAISVRRANPREQRKYG
jgi:uncharacterized DUF497 family protein